MLSGKKPKTGPLDAAVLNNNNNNDDDNKNDNDDNNNNNDDNSCIERCNSRLLPSPHCTVNCLQHVHSSGSDPMMYTSRAAHTALVTCSMLCITWYQGTAQLTLTGFKSRLFYFISLAEP